MRDDSIIDEACCGRFESAWLNGRPEPIDSCLPPQDTPSYRATLVELVEIELEFRWKPQSRHSTTDCGSAETLAQPPKVEFYLERFPQLADPLLLRKLVKQEFYVRHRYGDRPSQSEFRIRFPQLQLDDSELKPSQPATPIRTSLAGQAIDRYEIQQEHGRGGFGVVWRASDPKLGREVAIKQLSESPAGDREIRNRFANEARIAARLEHPGIVPVYDLGNLEADRPYYTMKLVRGRTFAEAIKQFHQSGKNRDSRNVEQLKLFNAFLAACRAIDYAHSQGVIHRDLKPQNIILGDFGETIVLDWGLARADQEGPLSPPAGADAGSVNVEVTQPGTIKGTPAYMSPEQAEGRIEDVDQLSDVYALGVILYELLTGRKPFTGSSTGELLKLVAAGNPPRPRSINRHVAPAAEAICLVAMAKEKGDRYGSVARLIDDLERYLADEPTVAWREPWHVRTARWARRHRTLVAGGGAAVVVGLVLLTVGVILLGTAYDKEREARRQAQVNLVEANRQEEIAKTQSRRAFGNFSVAKQAIDTLLVKVTSDDRFRARGMQPVREEMLESAAGFYEELAQQEAADKELNLLQFDAIGKLAFIRQELGQLDQALADLDAADQVIERLATDQPIAVNPLRAELLTTRGNLLRFRGDTEPAEQAYRESLALYEHLLEADPSRHAYLEGLSTCRNNLGVLLENQGRLPAAAENYRAAIADFERLLKENPGDAWYRRMLAAASMNLGLFYGRTLPPPELTKAAEINERALGLMEELAEELPEDPEIQHRTGMVLSNLAMVYRNMMSVDPANLAKARDTYRRAIEIQKSLVHGHPDVPDYFHKLATSWGNLSVVERFVPDVQAAEVTIRRSLAIRESEPLVRSTLPVHRYALAGDYLNLGSLLHALGRGDEAVDLLKEAASETKELTATYPDDVTYPILQAKIHMVSGQVAADRGQHDDAVASYARSIDVVETLRSNGTPFQEATGILLSAIELCGTSFEHLGRFDDADDHWQRAKELSPGESGRIAFDQATAAVMANHSERAARLATAMFERAMELKDVTRAFNAARIFAQAASVVGRDMAVAESDHEAMIEKCASEALAILASLQPSGALDTPMIRSNLAEAPEWDSIRQRPEFQQLLQALRPESLRSTSRP